jgi:AraC-like DNA-binding protein
MAVIQDIRLTGCAFLKEPFLPQSVSPGSEEYHLFFIFDGDGLLTIDSTTYPCSKDTLFFFPRLEVAFCRPGNRSSLTVLRVSFTCSSSELARELHKLPVSRRTYACHRTLFLEILHEYCTKKPFYEDLCCLYLEQLLLPLAVDDARRRPRALGFPGLTAKPEDALLPACTYIEQHLNDSISIDTLCGITLLSSRQLVSAFRKNFHLSPAGYIGSRRLEKAKELLAFSDCTITQIAEQTGFKSVHYFSNFFKSKIGSSPQEYRTSLFMQ